ncbi:ribosomal-protein-alanine N-acetyltransferase [Paenibacillus taihuensis]|uniref:Ribosomal-protein-alanine N-acetyltransferase n=1 Tax=Paenibacillus taihuensis TaxID=1156355 RepID=A0A3D9S3A9_9BACL|nr:GNAT family N-acetyltransferase [Paenibacillus taihuensis]REE84394.1 ribosomal-protein-alanine N-acetyltransferase [Paenibacillus taihuensis]
MNEHIPALRTKRLVLRAIDESYAEQALDFVLRNKEALLEWEPARNDDYYTLDVQKQFILNDLQSMRSGQSAKFWFSESEQRDAPLLGTITLNNIVRGAFQSCHLGYRTDVSVRGKGYMTEALAQVIGFAWSELNLHRIEANIMPRNGASLTVVEKLGFKHEGIARDYLRISGHWEDHIHMVLLNPMWKEI